MRKTSPLNAFRERKQVIVRENITTKGTKDTKKNLILIPRLAAGTEPMGYPKERSGSSSLWSTTVFKPRG